MAKVMVTITSDSAPTLEEVAARYNLDKEDVDTEFGIIEVERGIYTLLVSEAAADIISRDQGWETSGPYSNPKVEPFGPPQP